MIERFRSSQGGFRRLRAASYFARGGKVTKTPPGTPRTPFFIQSDACKGILRSH